MSDLTENIMELCRENDTTYTKMCADTGVSRSLLTEIRKGRKQGITAKTAQKIADYFGVTVDRVLYGKRDEPTIQVEGDTQEEWLEDARSRPELKVLFSATKGMTREQIEKTANWIAEMRKGWD